MSQCGAETLLGQCPDEAEFLVVAGCRHEHIGTKPLCVWHATDIQRPDSRSTCGHCHRGERSHTCRLAVRSVTPLEKEDTRADQPRR